MSDEKKNKVQNMKLESSARKVYEKLSELDAFAKEDKLRILETIKDGMMEFSNWIREFEGW